MKPPRSRSIQQFCLLLLLTAPASTRLFSEVMLDKAARGGGLDTNAPMIHVDVSYDEATKAVRATLDPSHGVPHLTPLPIGYAFDPGSRFAVLSGKAHNLQYAWNPGGIFAPPPGAAVWIECLRASPGLENYDGPGNKMENPPRPFTPILGTGGSPTLWKWYGRMAHNAFAIRDPSTATLSADYRVYFGDEGTGARDAFLEYDEATVTLSWTVDPIPPQLLFAFGALEEGGAASLAFLNAASFDTSSRYFVDLKHTTSGPRAGQFEGEIPMVVLPATPENGGPAEHHAALGAHVEVEWVSLTGPPGATLGLWEPEEIEARFTLPVGDAAGRCRFAVSENQVGDNTDPYGHIQGRWIAVDRPGLYCLGFRLVDTSNHGADGGPLHPPSETYQICLQAGVSIRGIERHDSAVRVSFAGQADTNFYLERAQSLDALAPWEAVSSPLRGMHRLQQLTDPTPLSGPLFYRLRTGRP